jgi:hypothetical protein
MNALTLFAYSYPLSLVLLFGFWFVVAMWKGDRKYYGKITTAKTLSLLVQGSVTVSVFHSSLRKIMHVTA